MIFDTIAAISTARGEGGIAIVRLSGDLSQKILKNIFRDKNKKKVESFNSFSLNYGFIVDENEKIADEVVAGIMLAPNTYTREDIIEINCHGGTLVTNKILEIVLKNGARLATPGEFTKRAFMNGRIGLSQAEAVIEIIRSKTENAVNVSIEHLRGDLQEKIKELKKLLIDVASHVNVVLDYPEEGIDDPLPDDLYDNLKEAENQIIKLIKSYDKGKKIRDGIKTAIIGKPNVGKSSLLNCLLREERAIVTNIPGTTRDIIEEVININGIPLVLVDTAGIRETDDIIENIGVNKSRESISAANLILFVIDGSEEIDNQDMEIYNNLTGKDIIGIINKSDKIQKADISRFENIKLWINISAKEDVGIEKMEDEIYNHIISKEIETSSEEIIITNIRHKIALENTLESIKNIFVTIDKKMPMDLISIDLNEALSYLSEITGEITSEDILDNIFKNFCVGK